MTKAITYDEMMELAKANYNKGGDSYYECWDEQTFNEWVSEFGPLTKTKVMKMFKDNAEMEHEEEEARKFYSGEDGTDWSNYEAEMTAKQLEEAGFPETAQEIRNEMTQATTNNTNKEDKNMNNKTNGQAQVMQIEVNGVKYTTTRPNYYYKNENGKQTRVSKAEWEKAFEEYTQTASDNAEQDAWQAEADEMIEKMEQKQAESDKQAEDAINAVKHMDAKDVAKVVKDTVKKAKAKAPRKSKDIAYEGNGVTLTEKQVAFIKLLPTCSFWEEGIDSALWCDCIAMDINWNPMSVGAMISTLREKSLATVEKDSSRKGSPKFMAFTELGKRVAQDLGLN